MRIAFTGPESTGKTTFSKWLSQELSNSECILEYAREYLEEREIISASAEDFKAIAREQCSLFNDASTNHHQIFDTDIFVLRIWNQEIYQLKLPELEILPDYKMDIHFLCSPDVAWEEDPLRSAPTLNERTRLYELYKSELNKVNCTVVELKGTREEKELLILSSIRPFVS